MQPNSTKCHCQAGTGPCGQTTHCGWHELGVTWKVSLVKPRALLADPHLGVDPEVSLTGSVLLQAPGGRSHLCPGPWRQHRGDLHPPTLLGAVNSRHHCPSSWPAVGDELPGAKMEPLLWAQPGRDGRERGLCRLFKLARTPQCMPGPFADTSKHELLANHR